MSTNLMGGDIKSRIEAETAKASGGVDEEWSVGSFKKIRDTFSNFRTTFSLSPRRTKASDDEIFRGWPDFGVIWLLGTAVRLHMQLNSHGKSFPFLFQVYLIHVFHLEGSLSLSAEPRRKGLCEPLFWSRSSRGSQNSRDALIPLLFPEPLPTAGILDRGFVSRSRSDGDSNEHSFALGFDRHLHPEHW